MRMDFSNTGETDLGSKYLAEKGSWHVVVTDVDDTFHRGDSIIVDFEVVGGRLIGKAHREYFSQTEKAMPHSAAFLLAVGLITKESLGKSVDVDWQQANGRQLVLHTVFKKDKDTHQLTDRIQARYCGFCAVNDPDAKGVELDLDLAGPLLGGSVKSPQPAANGNGAAASTAPPAAAAAVDPYGDL